MKINFLSILFFISIIAFIRCKDDIKNTDKRNENWAWWIDAKTGKGKWVPIVNDTSTCKNGRYTFFYSSGEIYSKGRLVNFKDVDTTYYYKLNGELLCYRLIKKDTIYYFIKDGFTQVYSQRKNLKAQGIIKNHTWGDEWTKYYENGNRVYTYSYIDGSGWCLGFYANGQIKDSMYHIKGIKRSPVYKEWYENGEMKSISQWKDTLREGVSITYYESGKMEDSSFYKEGKRENIYKTWNEDGTLHGIAQMKNDKINGRVVTYYSNGNIWSAGSCKDDLPEGEGKVYYENGRLKDDLIFHKGIITSFIIKNGKKVK
jgi:antitoxin component YwqK of YwqJK toxin-antitoxin module